MRAATFGGPGAITVGDRPYPVVVEPTDAVVRVALSSVCGTDVSPFRGESSFEPGPIGHEFVGGVEDAGPDVRAIPKGDLVIAPTAYSDGICTHCRAGISPTARRRPNHSPEPQPGPPGPGPVVRGHRS